MLKKFAAASVVAILMGYTLPVTAQSTETLPTIPSEKPSTETTPTTPPATEMQPVTPPAAPSPETTPSPEMSPSTTPPIEATPSTPAPEATPSAPAPTEVQPATPIAPSTSSPTVTPAADAKPTAKTMVLESETITGITEVSFPTPPVTPAFFTLPMKLRIVKDASITSNTPITDKTARDLQAWAAAIRACAADKPAFVRVVDDKEVPFMINGSEGKVRMNANDRPVCSA
ncbi:MAG: hypothetical protein HC780_07055 [Leptolyngbyaceae cyanobacterium CSU_1_3]|nr:hypothetical protein [Leptolyngbyaceae cyanobacterium CSU_1_3]